MRHVDREAVEAQLGAWAEELLGAEPGITALADAIAIDGKTLRGSKKPGASGAHLFSVLAHRVGLTLAQQAGDDQPNEIPVALALLQHLVLEGRMVPMDAVRTQRQIALHIVDAQGNSVMMVKENQLQLLEDIQTVCALPPLAGERRTAAETRDRGHGRSEQRGLQTRNILMGSSDGPGLAHVLRLERQVIIKKTGAVRQESVAGVTSLGPERAEAAPWLALVRGQWPSEHRSHGVRDVTCDEERSQVRCGNIPQVMAALRNTVIGLIRWAGHTNMAAACRHCAAQPQAALHLIGIEAEN